MTTACAVSDRELGLRPAREAERPHRLSAATGEESGARSCAGPAPGRSRPGSAPPAVWPASWRLLKSSSSATAGSPRWAPRREVDDLVLSAVTFSPLNGPPPVSSRTDDAERETSERWSALLPITCSGDMLLRRASIMPVCVSSSLAASHRAMPKSVSSPDHRDHHDVRRA